MIIKAAASVHSRSLLSQVANDIWWYFVVRKLLGKARRFPCWPCCWAVGPTPQEIVNVCTVGGNAGAHGNGVINQQNLH